MAADPSSFANVADVKVDHLDLKLNVDFATHVISGARPDCGWLRVRCFPSAQSLCSDWNPSTPLTVVAVFPPRIRVAVLSDPSNYRSRRFDAGGHLGRRARRRRRARLEGADHCLGCGGTEAPEKSQRIMCNRNDSCFGPEPIKTQL